MMPPLSGPSRRRRSGRRSIPRPPARPATGGGAAAMSLATVSRSSAGMWVTRRRALASRSACGVSSAESHRRQAPARRSACTSAIPTPSAGGSMHRWGIRPGPRVAGGHGGRAGECRLLLRPAAAIRPGMACRRGLRPARRIAASRTTSSTECASSYASSVLGASARPQSSRPGEMRRATRERASSSSWWSSLAAERRENTPDVSQGGEARQAHR